ncbi:MAG: hypothetical protein HY822_21080 [Acidobacteria bacterium]|nr:hypothetical protein [Acidobacteriota bacterium]
MLTLTVEPPDVSGEKIELRWLSSGAVSGFRVSVRVRGTEARSGTVAGSARSVSIPNQWRDQRVTLQFSVEAREKGKAVANALVSADSEPGRAGGLLGLLAMLAGIRPGDDLQLLAPRGRALAAPAIEFQWSARETPHHFRIRLLEDSGDAGPARPAIWTSADIGPTARSFRAEVETRPGARYRWSLDAFAPDASTLRASEEVAFSTLAGGQAGAVRAVESRIRGWMPPERPEPHLWLLLGLFFQSHRMLGEARCAYLAYLGEPCPRETDLSAAGALVRARLDELTSKRDRLWDALGGALSPAVQARRIAEMLEIDLVLLDYPHALWCAEQLARLEPGRPGTRRPRLLEEQTIFQELTEAAK